MLVSDACAGFLEARRLANVRPNTIRVHRMWFDFWGNWRDGRALDLAAVDISELRAFMAHLRDGHDARARNPRLAWAPSGRLGDHSLRSAWRSLRALWSWLAEEGELSDMQRGFFPRRLPCPQVEEVPRPVYTQAMFDALLDAAHNDADGLVERNVAALTLLAESGMRASEVCGMELSRLRTAEATAHVRGKGGRWGWVSWGDAGRAALEAWLAVRPEAEHDAVFVSLGRTNYGSPLTYNALRITVRRIEARAGIELPAGASIHALRHWFAHRMLDAGVDSLHLQQMMRHRDIRTTRHYVEQHPNTLRLLHQEALQRWE